MHNSGVNVNIPPEPISNPDNPQINQVFLFDLPDSETARITFDSSDGAAQQAVSFAFFFVIFLYLNLVYVLGRRWYKQWQKLEQC